MLQMSYGRGRGRCMMPDDIAPEIPPRRPGMPAAAKPTMTRNLSLDKLVLVDGLFNGPVEDVKVFNAIYRYLCVESWSDLENDLSHLATHIYSKTLSDTSNIDSIAKYVYLMSKNNRIGEQIKMMFFAKLEILFKDRDSLKRNGMGGYRNFLSLFSAMTHYCRNCQFAPFDDLVNGLFTLMEPLISSNEEADFRIFCICLSRYAKYLKMSDSKGKRVTSYALGDMTKLEIAIRQKITSEKVTKKTRYWLLLALDLVRCSYDELDDQLRAYYTIALEESLYMLSSKSEIIRIPRPQSLSFKLSDMTANIILI